MQTGEWSNLVISFTSPEYPNSYVLPTYVYFMNDASNLYVLVDASGDGHDNPNDECLLVFNYDSNMENWDRVEITGSSGTIISTPFLAAIGFHASPNNATSHKIYEFAIPFTYINKRPGDSIDFCSPFQGKFGSMSYDGFNGRDNIWPLGLSPFDINSWGILNSDPAHLAPSDPYHYVGGEIFTPNKLAVLSPYLALIGLTGVVASAVIVTKTRRRK